MSLPASRSIFERVFIFGLALVLFIGNPAILKAWTPGTTSPAATSGFVVDTTNRRDVLAYFNTVYTASEGYASRMNWTGSVSGGVAGTTSAAFKDDVRRRINFYRALAGLPGDITINATKSSKDQEAALMMSANSALSHTPPVSWTFYTANGAEAAGKSNISLGNYGPAAINGYMVDSGSNNYLVGHRRWLLYSMAADMGTGDVPQDGANSSANATWVIGNFKAAPAPQFVPWPNAGFVPATLVPARWSLSRPNANFSAASVTLKQGATVIPTSIVSSADNGYGDNTLVWTTSGIPSSVIADTTYTVTVTGISGSGVPTSFSWSVTLFDPNLLGESVTITGASAPPSSGEGYSFNSIAQADSYELEVSSGSGAVWTEGAEDSPAPQIAADITGSYSLRQATLVRTGGKAFHLAFPDFNDQSFTVSRKILPGATSNLQFYERGRFATTTTTLRAEISTDNGSTWTSLWSRNGAGLSSALWDSSWMLHSLSLAPYAGQIVQLRFIMRGNGGSIVLSTSTNDGFFLDDISVSNATELVNSTTTTLAGGASSFTLDSTTAGAALVGGSDYYMRIRPNVGTRWFGFGPVKIVTPLTLAINASLENLTLNAGILNPAFASSTTSYTSTVSNATTSITVTPTATVSQATIEVNGTVVTTGTASGDISLNVGSNIVTVQVTSQDATETTNYTINVTRAPPAPEIVVEQPASTILVDGAAGINFGSVFTNNTADLVFTVRNTGEANLTGLTITKDGTSAALFTVIANPTAPVVPGGSTTFIVRFTPISLGTKTAALHIASNDADESPFDITLTGTGITPVSGKLALGGAIFTVHEEDGTVNIPITRTSGTDGVVSVLVSTSNGSALAGSDYIAVTNQLVTWVTGDGATKNVPITILNPASIPELSETFLVTLSSPTGGATLGTQKTATTVILDSVDTTIPGTPAITAPGSGAKLNVNPGGTVTVTGTAKDNQRVASVEVSLNGGSFVPAAVTPTGSGSAFGSTANFSINVTPATGGTNTVVTRTIDGRGNVSAVSASRSFVVLRPLAVSIAGSGTVASGFAPTSFREIGVSYSISAKPASAAAPGFAFNGWTISGGPSLSEIGVTAGALEVSTLNFVFREGLVLTANFIVNPFSAAVTGAFNGLIMPSPTLPSPGVSLPSNETVGMVTATVGTTGALSGKLLIDGTSLSFAGVFDNSGTARFGTNRATTLSVVRTTKPSYDLTLHLDLAPAGNNKITGTFTLKLPDSIKSVSLLDADRAYYNGTTVKVPENLAGTSSKAYTAVFPAKSLGLQVAGFTAAGYPQGDGYATVSVKNNGTVSVVGKLADGTAISASAPLSNTNTWPLFQQLYPELGVKKGIKMGSIAGMVTLDDAQVETDLAGTNLLWFRPLQLVQWYPNGWTGGILVDLMGAKYVVPPSTPATSVFPGPGNPPSALKAVDLVNGNVGITFSDGLLSSSIIRSVNISPTNVVTKPTTNTDANFTLSLTSSTGVLTGAVTHTDGTKLTFQGVIIQKGTQRGAYGYFLTKQPAVIDYTGESGGVSLMAQP